MSNVIELVKPSFARIDQECAQLAPTDAGNAKRFVARFGDVVRWVDDTRQWLLWTDNKWSVVSETRIEPLVTQTAELIAKEAECVQSHELRNVLYRHCLTSQHVARQSAILKGIKSSSICVLSSDLDCHDHLLATKNGYLIDLKTSEVRKIEQSDLITKLVNADYDPKAESQHWVNLLNAVFEGDCELIDYFQALCGYSATGLTTEELMVFLYGDGANGKTTVQDSLKAVLGDYSGTMETENILKQKHARHTAEIAVLNGKRFVTCAELARGRQLNESIVKNLTSGDSMLVRHMCQKPFEMQSRMKLWVSTNNLPVVDYADNAIWRRIKLIRFNHVFNHETGIDKTMRNKLKSEKEKSGILNWLISGAYKYYTNGLIEPESVTNDTLHWRHELNIVSRFIAEECVADSTQRIMSSELYSAFCGYLKDNGELQNSMSHTIFGKELKRLGYQSSRCAKGIVVRSLGLRQRDHDQQCVSSVGLSESFKYQDHFSKLSDNHTLSAQTGIQTQEKASVFKGFDSVAGSVVVSGVSQSTPVAPTRSPVIVVFVHTEHTLSDTEYRRLAKQYAEHLPGHLDSSYIHEAIMTHYARQSKD